MTKVGAVQSPTFCGSTFLGSCVQALKKLAEKVRSCCMSILQTLLPCCFSPSNQRKEIKPAVPLSPTEDPVGKKIKGLQNTIDLIRTLSPKEVVSTERVPEKALKTVLIAAINTLGMSEADIDGETLDGIIKLGVAEYELNEGEAQDFEQVIERAGFTFLDPVVEERNGIEPRKNMTLRLPDAKRLVGQHVNREDFRREIEIFAEWLEENVEKLGQSKLSSILMMGSRKRPIRLGLILHRRQNSKGDQEKRYIFINPNCDRHMKCSVFEDVNSLSSAIALLVPPETLVQFEQGSRRNKVCNIQLVAKKDTIVTDNDAVPFILLQALLFSSERHTSEAFENTCRTFISDGTEMLEAYRAQSGNPMEFLRSKGLRFEEVFFDKVSFLRGENLWVLFDEKVQRYYGAVVNGTGEAMLISAEKNRPLKLQRFERFEQLLTSFGNSPKIFRIQGEFDSSGGYERNND